MNVPHGAPGEPARRRVLVALLAGVLLVGSSCSREEPRQGVRWSLEAEMRAALARSDSAAVRLWIEREGATRAKFQIYALVQGISVANEAEHARSLDRIRDPVLLLARSADEAFDVGLSPRCERVLGWSLAERRQVADLEERTAAAASALVPGPERERLLRALLAESRALPAPHLELIILHTLGRCLADQTRTVEAFALYREALAISEATRDRWFELQFLGVVGHYQEQEGDFDAMRATWEEGIALADRTRIAEHGARLRVFLANHFAQQGRYSIARELFDEADACVRDPSGREFEVRLVQRRMEFHAALECWEVVDGLLERQREILASPAQPVVPATDIYRSRLARMAARRETARGNLEAAGVQWDVAARMARDSSNREEWADVLLERGRATLDAGRVEEARPLLEEGLVYAEGNNLPRRAVQLRALAGAASVEANAKVASDHLDEFAGTAVGPENGFAREWALHDAARVRLAIAAGDTAAAWELAERGAVRASRIARATDPGGAGYLLLEQLDPIWRVGDELRRDDPEAALLWEMRRRRLLVELGAETRGEPPTEPAGDLATLRAELARRDAALAVWRTGRERIDVWLVDRDHVRREVAPGRPADARRAVERFVDAVALSQGGPAAAARAGELVLPDAFRTRLRAADRILFCPDGFISLAPLELLPDPDGQPWIENHDVAMLRFRTSRTEEIPANPKLVVGPPRLPAAVTRRWPSLAHLEGATEEARAVAVLLRPSRLLEREGATKADILAAWRAPVLHVSAHFVRDPLVPFVTFVPLSAGPTAPREQSHLDVLDVRRTSFHGTELVVLSGCGSGAPWVGTVMAPGLGEAFLDAGADAVVQTRWSVDDAVARDLVLDFTRRYAAGENPVAALNAVKREARRRGVIAFHWASYSIVIAEL